MNRLKVYAYVFRTMNRGDKEAKYELCFMDSPSMKKYYYELCNKYEFVHVFKDCL